MFEVHTFVVAVTVYAMMFPLHTDKGSAQFNLHNFTSVTRVRWQGNTRTSESVMLR